MRSGSIIIEISLPAKSIDKLLSLDNQFLNKELGIKAVFEAPQLIMRGKDVETAISLGLSKWNVNRDEVLVEVIDEGHRGFLGIGQSSAEVRLTLKNVETDPSREGLSTQEQFDNIKIDPQIEMVVDVIKTILNKLQVEAEITFHLSEPDDLTGRRIYIFDIQGSDLGVLIGPRGEALSALQYIVRLIVSQQLNQRVDFVIDIEGYRQRRQQALARLAERMAKKVVTRRRPVSLDALPPSERRIIHSTLRNHKEVITKNVGKGHLRKVQIIPKEE